LRFGERQTNDGTHFTAEGLSKSFAAPDRRLGSMICSKTVEANLLAVLGLRFRGIGDACRAVKPGGKDGEF
jgi:hypothetical protein